MNDGAGQNLTPQGPAQPAVPPVSGSAIDAYFDRELDAARTRDLLADMRADTRASEDVARTQRMLSLLRRSPLHAERAEEERIDAIMARVDRRRRFLPDAWRRFVTAGRLATAATFLFAGLAVAVLGRTHPDALRLAPSPSPIASLVQTTRQEAAETVARCYGTLDCLTDQAVVRFAEGQGVPAAEHKAFSPLRAGDLATVRLASDKPREALVIESSAGGGPEFSTAGFTLGMEFTVSRQRCGRSAPVLLPAVLAVAAESQPQAAPGLAARAVRGLPAAVQTVAVGDHVLFVPTDVSPWPMTPGPAQATRLLFIQATPSDSSAKR